MGKLKELKDFKSTPYYEYYIKRIEEYNTKIINTIMTEQDNDVKYTRNNVMQEVFKFVNEELREFPDSLDVNPRRDEMAEEAEEKLRKEAIKTYLGYDTDMK